jgi:hypothetical protein
LNNTAPAILVRTFTWRASSVSINQEGVKPRQVAEYKCVKFDEII